MSALGNIVTSDWTRHPKAYGFNALSQLEFVTVSPGAGVVNGTVQGIPIIMPVAFKIPKVAVYLSAIDSVAGTDLFNIVVGTGAYVSAAASAAPNDNSDQGPPPGGLGVPTNVATAGQTVFGADVALTAANFPNLTTGSGGYGILIPANYDAVYPAGTPITQRVVTTAGTGSISNFKLRLLIMPVTLTQSWQTPASPIDLCTPGKSF
jgi:hypothetical protein